MLTAPWSQLLELEAIAALPGDASVSLALKHVGNLVMLLVEKDKWAS